MKNKLIFNLICTALIVLGTTSCTQNFRIIGVWENGAGDTVSLLKQIAPDSTTTLATTIVKDDGTFALEGALDYPQRFKIAYKGKEKQIFVGSEPINVTISSVESKNPNAKQKLGYKCQIESNREQQVLETGSDLHLSISLLQFASMVAISRAVETGNKPHIDSVIVAVDSMKVHFSRQVKFYLDSTRNDISTTYYIADFMIPDNTLEEVRQAYDALGDGVKISGPGLELKERIEKMSQVNVGGIAPNFELPTPEGKMLSLAQLRGKYVLLDFWASWCAPCMAEMPNVKQIYAKYHDKGLEVLGISLDNKADLWKNSIAKHTLDWNHISSLKGFECPVARLFNITGIPRMYIIDPQGVIIAQDLRGEELAQKMDELFAPKN